MSFEEIEQIVEDQFLDIITDILKPSFDKLRLVLKDGSFIDVRISHKIKNRFDFHWEKKHIDDTIYRYDNFPDVKTKRIKTFPFHFHKRKEKKIVPAPFAQELPQAFIDFMNFVRKTLSA